MKEGQDCVGVHQDHRVVLLIGYCGLVVGYYELRGVGMLVVVGCFGLVVVYYVLMGVGMFVVVVDFRDQTSY